MAKFAANSVLDALLEAIKSGTTTMLFNTSQPVDRAAAISNSIAGIAMLPGDFSISDATPNGRMITIGSKVDVPVTATGDVAYVSLISGSELLYVTTATIKEITAGDVIRSQAWTIRISDPV